MTVIIRILLRYLVGFLVCWGVITALEAQALANDPEIINLIVTNVYVLTGALLSAISEAWYALAKRFGWRT